MTSVLFLLAAALPDPAAWDAFLKRYVSTNHRVDYARIQADGTAPLDAYLAALAAPFPAGVRPAEKKAAYINAYNALMIRWIVTHYPIRSVWKTKKAFTQARHKLNGQVLSLDQIETALRDERDPRVHAVLVCAARSCPPLRREAYDAARLEEQLDSNTRAWLADPRLNAFDSSRGRAEISSIFEWYAGDFPALKDFLVKYGPPAAAGAAKISYKSYDWGLNDTGTAGDNYSGFRMKIDYFLNH